jgi:hypothetical protein
MAEWRAEYEENDEIPEEYMEEVEEDPEETPKEELEIPDVCWEKQLKEIDDPEIQKREIKAAEEIVEKQKELDVQYDAGEITDHQHWVKYHFEIIPEKSKAMDRASMASINLTYDELGEVGEELGDVCSEAAGDRRPVEFKEKVKESIEILGPDFVDDLKEEKIEKDEMPEEIGERVSRQLRIHRKEHSII